MIIAPNRFDNIIEQDKPVLRFSEYLEAVELAVNTLTSNTDAYTVENGSTDRTFDADAAAGDITSPPSQSEVENIRDAVLELADVMATLIVDLQNAEIVP